PWPIPSAYIEQLRHAQDDMAFDDTTEARIHRREQGRTARETVKLTFPVGSVVMVTDGPFAGFHGHVESVTGRGLVRAMVSIFGGLTPVEVDPRQVRAERSVDRQRRSRERAA